MTVARNTLAYWVSQIGNFGLSFVSSIFVAVILGPDRRGILVAVILVNTLAISLTNLGIQSMSMYFVGREPERVGYFHTLVVILVLLISVVDFSAVWIAGELLQEHVPPQLNGISWGYLAVAVGILPFSLYYFAAQGILTGLGRIQELSRVLFYYSAIANGANLLTVGLIAGDNPRLVDVLITVWAAGQVLLAVVFYVKVRKTLCGWARLSFSEGILGLGRMLSYGLRAFIGNFASALINRNDHIFVLPRYGTAGLGVYNLSAKLAELIFQPSAAFENAGYAQVVRSERKESARLVQDLFRMNFLVNVCGLALLMLLGGPLISRFLHEYQAAILPLFILLPGTLFLSGARMLALYFSAQLGRPQIPSAIAWLAALINTGLLWWVVVHRDAGLTGAAAVTTSCYAFMFVSSWMIFATLTGLRNPVPYFIPQPRDYRRLGTLLKGVIARRGV